MFHTMVGEPANLNIIPEVGGAASNITANFSYTSFVVSWNKSEEPDLNKYLILYKMDPNSGSYDGSGLTYAEDLGNTNSPISVATNSLVDPNNPSVELDGMLMDTPYWFAIIAVNNNQNESSLAILDVNITPTASAFATMSFSAPAGVVMNYNSLDDSILFTWQIVE